jgi:hypothetical protein
MNDQIKLSIDGRRSAFENAYELTPDAKKKVDALFKEIETLGKECSDSADFEAKLAASPLNQKYINLFTELSQSCKSKLTPTPDAEIEPQPTKGEVVADLAKNDIEMATQGAVQYVRGRVFRDAYGKALKTPVIGDAIDAKNKIDLLRRFKK